MGLTGTTMMKDGMRALLVLAFVFFNFAHDPVSARTAYDTDLNAYLLPVSAAFIDCGERGDDSLAHPPCHACRIGGAADLPPAPRCADAIARTAETVAFALDLAAIGPTAHLYSATPRGPPAA